MDQTIFCMQNMYDLFLFFPEDHGKIKRKIVSYNVKIHLMSLIGNLVSGIHLHLTNE